MTKIYNIIIVNNWVRYVLYDWNENSVWDPILLYSKCKKKCIFKKSIIDHVWKFLVNKITTS